MVSTPCPETKVPFLRWADTESPDQLLAIAGLLRSALIASPDNPSLHVTLAKALTRADRLNEAESTLRDALARSVDHEALYEQLAFVLARQGEIEAALAIARARSAPWAPVFQFKLLTRQGRRSEAEELESQVAALRPADPDLLKAQFRRVRDDPRRLISLCDEVLANDPGASHAIYYKLVALCQLGLGEQAAATIGLDRFLSVGTLPLPTSFDTDEQFREAIRGEILASPSLLRDPAGHATRSGLRTRTFPAVGDRAAPALVRSLQAAVDAYAGALSGDHGFVRATPAVATMTQWALLFTGGGHQLLHHHPGAWLTGVYYVSNHRESAPGDGAKAGAIRIGGLPDWAGVAPPWPLIVIAPSPGTLLVFPSFVPHETVPPGDQGERISVAFDVMAAAPT